MTEPPASLATFLRALRERHQPAEFGLPAGQRRRTPGLRREEAALLCGISPAWLTGLEQGRETTASPSTLAAIARGLRLSPAERRYLFRLAGRDDPRPGVDTVPDLPMLQTLVDAIATPAYLLDRHWRALAWNREAAALFVDWLGAPSPDTLLDYVFLHPSAPAFIVDWPARSRRLVAEFRADSATGTDPAATAALVERLSAHSADFRAAWSAQQVEEREGGRRSFARPDGILHCRQFTLRPSVQPDLKLVILVAETDADD